MSPQSHQSSQLPVELADDPQPESIDHPNLSRSARSHAESTGSQIRSFPGTFDFDASFPTSQEFAEVASQEEATLSHTFNGVDDSATKVTRPADPNSNHRFNLTTSASESVRQAGHRKVSNYSETNVENFGQQEDQGRDHHSRSQTTIVEDGIILPPESSEAHHLSPSHQVAVLGEGNVPPSFWGLPELGTAPELDESTISLSLENGTATDSSDAFDLGSILQRFHADPLSFNTGFNSEQDGRNDDIPIPYSRNLQQQARDSLMFFPDESPSPSALGERGNIIEIKDESSTSDLDTHTSGNATRKVKGRKAKATSSAKRSSTKDVKAKINKKGPQKGAKRAKGRRSKQETPKADLRGLFENNIIAQATANQELGSQPTFGGSNRQAALRQLINSMPLDQQNLYRGDKVELDEAAKVFVGRGRKLTAMRADGEAGWLLRGMTSHLKHHQLLGAAFMRRREKEGTPYGGVIGDVMGFGKTVICLANMVDGMPPREYAGPPATLIVVPSALMGQWRSEIEKHVERDTFSNHIMIFGRDNRLTGYSDKASLLGSQNIVITSYHEVMASYPINDPPSQLTTDRARQEWWVKHLEENRGPLHRVTWYRVVLDESQAIKNHLSRTSIAVRALEGKFRWVLSGTPVLNNLKEWYSTLDFLRLSHIGSYDLFCRNFCRRGSTKALQRLQITLDKIMLRRTHKDKLFGQPIVKLPAISTKTVEVTFNSVERAIYTIVLDRFCKRLSPLGASEQNYSSILVLLLRLRQLVGHIFLIQRTLKDLLETEDLEQLWFLTDPSTTDSDEAARDGSKETALALESALTQISANDQALARERAADNQISADLRNILQDLNDRGDWAKANDRSMCQACGSAPERPVITHCRHIYCNACLNDMTYAQRAKGRSNPNCYECGSEILESATWYAKAFAEAAKNSKAVATVTTDEDISWINMDRPMLRGAKIHACIEQLRSWFHEDIANKVIIFVQFRGLIKVISRILEEEGWGYETFDGTMSFHSRQRAIQDFSEKSERMVLVAALKAGGIGLNLTAANKIVIIDVWWNQLTEDQAFSRAYRIGQERDVEVVRFVVKNTIDTKIMQMQASKTLEIDSAFQDGCRRNLSLAQLNELWGELCKDREAEEREASADAFVAPDDPYDARLNTGDTIMSGMTV